MIYFQEHDHFIGKQEKDILIYQESVKPSHPSFQYAHQTSEFGYMERQILPNSGDLPFHVNQHEVNVKYARAFLPAVETGNRKNKDVYAPDYLDKTNCRNSLFTGPHVLWNCDYTDELIYPNPLINETKITFSVTDQQVISPGIHDETERWVRCVIDENPMIEERYEVIRNGSYHHG